MANNTLPLTPWWRRWWMIIIWIILAISVIGGVSSAVGGDDAPTVLDVEAVEDMRKGFHCLSDWDGNHDGLESLVRDRLNDPDSMETDTTRIGPSGTWGDDDHVVAMDFRARNAFGGMIRNEASGWVDHETCQATLLLIE